MTLKRLQETNHNTNLMPTGISEKVSIVYMPLPKDKLGLSDSMRDFGYQEINSFPFVIPGRITSTICFGILSVCVKKMLT